MDERERSTARLDKPVLEETKTLLDTPYIRVYELCYADGLHYYDASRRKKEALSAVAHRTDLPDAVSGFVSVKKGEEEPRLLLFYEYRYPIGEYVLSIPSGLIDRKDHAEAEPIVTAMVREITEETGLHVKDTDTVEVLTPMVYNSPGMTDESTALVAVHLHVQDYHELSHDGAEGSERFADILLVTREEAAEILKRGRDAHGTPIPMVTRSALTWFVYEDRQG